MAVDSVTILTLHRADDARVFGRQARTLAKVAGCVRLITPFGESRVVEGAEIIAVSSPPSRAQRFFATPFRLLREFLRRPTRFVYLHDAPLLVLVPTLRALGFEVIYDVHEDYAHMVAHRDWVPRRLRPLAGRFTGWYEQAFARPAHAVVAATSPLLDRFVQRDKVALYNLPTTDFIEAGARQTTPCHERKIDVVHLGSLSDARLEFFARMVESLSRAWPDLRVLVIGLLAHQVGALRRRFSEERMTIVERAPHAMVPSLLGDCKIGVDIHPWLYPHLAVAVPVKVFEYMACGCAVVTSHLPELLRFLDSEDRELVAVVRGDDPDEYARVVFEMLQNPKWLESAAGRLRSSVARRYTWDRESEKLVDLFARLSARPEPRRGRVIRRLLGGLP